MNNLFTRLIVSYKGQIIQLPKQWNFKDKQIFDTTSSSFFYVNDVQEEEEDKSILNVIVISIKKKSDTNFIINFKINLSTREIFCNSKLINEVVEEYSSSSIPDNLSDFVFRKHVGYELTHQLLDFVNDDSKNKKKKLRMFMFFRDPKTYHTITWLDSEFMLFEHEKVKVDGNELKLKLVCSSGRYILQVTIFNITSTHLISDVCITETSSSSTFKYNFIKDTIQAQNLNLVIPDKSDEDRKANYTKHGLFLKASYGDECLIVSSHDSLIHNSRLYRFLYTNLIKKEEEEKKSKNKKQKLTSLPSTIDDKKIFFFNNKREYDNTSSWNMKYGEWCSFTLYKTRTDSYYFYPHLDNDITDNMIDELAKRWILRYNRVIRRVKSIQWTHEEDKELKDKHTWLTELKNTNKYAKSFYKFMNLIPTRVETIKNKPTVLYIPPSLDQEKQTYTYTVCFERIPDEIEQGFYVTGCGETSIKIVADINRNKSVNIMMNNKSWVFRD